MNENGGWHQAGSSLHPEAQRVLEKLNRAIAKSLGKSPIESYIQELEEMGHRVAVSFEAVIEEEPAEAELETSLDYNSADLLFLRALHIKP